MQIPESIIPGQVVPQSPRKNVGSRRRSSEVSAGSTDTLSTTEEADWTTLPSITPSQGSRGGGSSISSSKSQTYQSEKKEHSLVEHAPEAAACIKFVRLRFFQQLLLDTSKPLPRCQDLPKKAFGRLHEDSVLVAISHGWYFQCHPDPYGEKMLALRKILETVSFRYPMLDILIFFDFVSLSQRPYCLGQKPRTAEEQHVFRKSLKQLHHCYVYADALIHLDSTPHSEDGSTQEAIIDMSKVELDKIGDVVQVVGLLEQQQEEEQLDGLNVFDILHSIDGAVISHVAQVPNHKAFVCYYKRPYGKINPTPLHERGWVYLERFITMIKAAMIDREEFHKCIFTNSVHAEAILVAGSNRLREAAEGGRFALGLELNRFKEELSGKSFSATSTDKLVLDADAVQRNSSNSSTGNPACEDALTVANLMDELVTSFGSGWGDMQQQQQQIARSLILKATADYFLKWDQFSDGFLQQLAAVSTRDPRPIVGLMLFLLLQPLLVVLLPYESADKGWEQQSLFLIYANPFSFFTGFTVFTGFWTATLGLQLDFPLICRYCVWLCAMSVSASAIIFGIAAAFNIFPVPFEGMVGVSCTAPIIPALWWCTPAAVRAEKGFKWHAFYTSALILCIVAAFVVVFPMINAAMAEAESVWRPVLLLAFVIGKLGFERFGQIFSKRLRRGADSMPIVLFISSLCYEFNLCIILSGGFEAFVFAELLAFDAIENFYHLWSLHRSSHKEGSEQETDSTTSAARNRQHYIVCSLLIREMNEICTPIIFLCQIIAIRWIQPRPNDIVCAATDAEFGNTITYLVVDIIAEASIGWFTCTLLRRAGFEPLTMLCGLVSHCLPAFLAAGPGVLMFYFLLQHSHTGSDMTLEFKWIRAKGAQWQCGRLWY